MYWWPDGGWGWAAWLTMTLTMLAFWGLLAWVVVALARRPSGQPTSRPTAEEVLAERFARGEIDEEEYRRRREMLRSPR